MKVLLQHFRGKNGKVIIEKYNIAYLVTLSVKRATITTATVGCVSAAGCCAPPTVNTKRQEHVKTTWGTARIFFIPLREQLCE